MVQRYEPHFDRARVPGLTSLSVRDVRFLFRVVRDRVEGGGLDGIDSMERDRWLDLYEDLRILASAPEGAYDELVPSRGRAERSPETPDGSARTAHRPPPRKRRRPQRYGY